jgi:hypothetical protein
MQYIFDTNSLSNVLNHYYPERFPSFWGKFNEKIDHKKVISVREAKFELEVKFEVSTIEQLKIFNAEFFEDPTVIELSFITEIYSIPHFRQNLDRKKLLQGGYFADPFIIAKAKVKEGIVVTEEEYARNGSRIPNICQRFGIDCMNLEGFLIKEDWKF